MERETSVAAAGVRVRVSLHIQHDAAFPAGLSDGSVQPGRLVVLLPVRDCFKTPTATLLACLLAIVAAAVLVLRPNKAQDSSARQVNWWIIFCLSLPALVYGLISLSTRLNVGVRHVLP